MARKVRSPGKIPKSKRTELDIVPELFEHNDQIVRERVQRERGEWSEQLTAEALEFLRREEQIHYWLRAEYFGQLDQTGIDFLVWITSDSIVPLQVKSSEWGRQEHMEMYGDIVPHCIVVDTKDTVSILAEKIIMELATPVEHATAEAIAVALH